LGLAIAGPFAHLEVSNLKFVVPQPNGPAIPEYGITLSSRQLKRAEAAGHFPRRVAIYPGASVKGWPSVVIEEHLETLAQRSRAAH
jgi:hypothetical protein